MIEYYKQVRQKSIHWNLKGNFCIILQMSPDRLRPEPKYLEGTDAEFFLRRVSQAEEAQAFQRLTRPAAKPMTKEEADTTPGKILRKRGLRSANPFSIY